MRDPFPALARLHEAGPVVRVRVPFLGETWAATTFDAVNETLKDDVTFVRGPERAGKRRPAGMRWWMPRTLRVLARNMLGYNDPDHRRLRMLVDQAVNRQCVESLRTRIGGLCDDRQRLCFALALWNERDPILKERLFGLTNSERNHGEDVKEYYFYLDSTPTHS